MDIGPIGGIRLVPAIKERPADPELTAFFDIESAARSGDDSYNRGGEKAAGAEEPEDETEQDPESDQEGMDPLKLGAAAMPSRSQISFIV